MLSEPTTRLGLHAWDVRAAVQVAVMVAAWLGGCDGDIAGGSGLVGGCDGGIAGAVTVAAGGCDGGGMDGHGGVAGGCAGAGRDGRAGIVGAVMVVCWMEALPGTVMVALPGAMKTVAWMVLVALPGL